MSKPARPPMVTSACLFLGLSCALMLWYVVGWLTTWNSIEVQDGLRDALGRADLEQLGVSAEGAIAVVRNVLMVLVVPLVAGVVFAVYAARGHLQSRWMLCGVAGLAALSFVLTGGLIGVLPAALAVLSIGQLWSPDARRWFAEVNDRPVPPALVRTPTPQPEATQPPTPQPPATAPQPDPFAQRPDPATWQHPARAPRPVRIAVIVTAVSTGTAAFFSFLYLAVFLTARDELLQAQLDSPMRSMMDSTDDEIAQAMRVAATTCAIALVLSAAAVVAVVQLVRRRRSGHLALTILSGVTVVMGLITLAGLPWAGAAVWVLVLLRSPETRRWLEGAGA